LDIFEMTQTQMNQQKSMLTRNLLFFGVFKWMQKISNVLFNSEKNMNLCFLQLDYLLVRF
jgi:hypothetical protein